MKLDLPFLLALSFTIALLFLKSSRDLGQDSKKPSNRLKENYIIQRVPMAKWLSLNIILWGITLALHAATKQFVGLVVLRGFLGGFEAACQPTFVVLSAMW